MTLHTAPMRGRGSPTVVIAANSSWNLLNFRAPLIRALRERNFTVVAATPGDEGADALEKMGVFIERVSIDARGTSLFADIRLLLQYDALLRRIEPGAFLPFTAKPNIYGSLAATRLGIPVINTITGLGTGFLGGRALQAVMAGLYRVALRRSKRVLFHNPDDRELFLSRSLVTDDQASLVPGSGVDLERFAPQRARRPADPPTFLFIGRLLRDKGAEEFAEAAAMVKARHSAAFQVLGAIEDHPKAVAPARIEEWQRQGVIELLGTTDDVRPFIANSDCVVLPSYREGLPRVLLEASAMAKAVIATDVPGCRHAVDHGTTGLLCMVRSAEALAGAMIQFLGMSHSDRFAMGLAGRAKAEREFSQELVIQTYLDELDRIDGIS